jgi:hypothetical protein
MYALPFLLASVPVHVDPLGITTGGVSAGCFASTQFHFAYSQTVKGNACIAGGPFYCAQASETLALTQCMMAESAPFINVPYLADIVRNTASNGFLDPVVGLGDARAWFYSARNDSVVAPLVVEKNAELYWQFVMNASSLQTVFDHSGEHAVPTDGWGNPCIYLGSPYINDCGYDAAGTALEFLYAGKTWLGFNAKGVLYSLNQTMYTGGTYDPLWGLAETGYLWVPDGCAGRRCKLHVHFHGCLQSYSDVGFDYIYESGFSGWSDLVVLYPQAVASAVNPNGCWDWWGYTGPAYASNIGVQNSAVWRIVQDLL